MSVIRNLSRTYAAFGSEMAFRLHIPYWELPDQGITVLSGPSGSGKSSVLRVLMGLDPCPGLSWMMGDEDLARLAPGARRLGVVFQSYELFPHLKASENILFAAQARGVPKQKWQTCLDELSRALQLQSCLQTRAGALSGGEAQRVALARALVGEPRMLLLDEPFSALDMQLREEARKLVRSVIERLKIPTLLVTHDEQDKRALADQVVTMHRGEVRASRSV